MSWLLHSRTASYIRYTSQVADFHEPFNGIIADYTQKHCWVSAVPPYVPVECSAEGLPWNIRRRLHSNLRTPEDNFADSITCVLPKIVRRTPIRRIQGSPKDNSTDPERQFHRLATDNPRTSTQTFTKIRDGLPWKLVDFHK